MPFLTHEQQFREKHQTTPQSFVLAGTGSAELQVKAGNQSDPDVWVKSEDENGNTVIVAPVVCVVHVSLGQIYRWQISGDVTIWIADTQTELLT